jgi:UDP-glucose 4-epimerase
MLHHTQHPPAKPARVVVMGAGGFVGGAIANRLERDGIAVLRLTRRNVDLLASSAANRLSAHLRRDDVLIAVAALAPCKTTEMLRDNMLMSYTLAKAAASGDLAHVINISSDAVYADSDEPLTEASPTAPDTLHGTMHLAREAMFKAEAKAPLAILRPTLLYGVEDPHNGYGPNRFRRLASRGEPISLFGEGEERRDHVLIDDLAEIAARVVACRSAGSLNIATGRVTSFRELAEAVVRLSRNPVPIVGTPRSGPMPHNGYRAFDIAACRASFPNFRYTELPEGLARVQQLEAVSSSP